MTSHWRRIAESLGATQQVGSSWKKKVARYLDVIASPGRSWAQKISDGKTRYKESGGWPGRIVPPDTADGRSSPGRILVGGVLGDGGGEPEQYIAQAVHFDGSTRMHTDSLTATDNEHFSFAFWYKANLLSGRVFFASDPEFAYSPSLAGVFSALDTDITVSLTESGNIYSQFDYQNIVAGDGWILMLGSFNTQTDAGTLYVNDVKIDGASFTPPDDPFDLTMNGKALHLIQDGFEGNPFWVVDLADVRIMPGISLLNESGDIPEATRRLFIDAAGKPVNPSVATAALGTPCILFSGDATGFATNQGNGGAFTVTGTLTNASTSPSDNP